MRTCRSSNDTTGWAVLVRLLLPPPYQEDSGLVSVFIPAQAATQASRRTRRQAVKSTGSACIDSSYGRWPGLQRQTCAYTFLVYNLGIYYTEIYIYII
jgi:hypothetical protein